jgi:hypothetical protein
MDRRRPRHHGRAADTAGCGEHYRETGRIVQEDEDDGDAVRRRGALPPRRFLIAVSARIAAFRLCSRFALA